MKNFTLFSELTIRAFAITMIVGAAIAGLVYVNSDTNLYTANNHIQDSINKTIENDKDTIVVPQTAPAVEVKDVPMQDTLQDADVYSPGC